MENNKNIWRKILVLGILWITFAYMLFHLKGILEFFQYIWTLCFPLVLGFAIAFVMNVPMKWLEAKMIEKSKKKEFRKWMRMVSYLCTLTFIVGIIYFLIQIVVPQMVDAVTRLVEKTPYLLGELQTKLGEILNEKVDLRQFDKEIEGLYAKFMSWISKEGGVLLNTGVSAVSGIFSGFMTFILGFIFSIYILFEKETLGQQIQQVMKAFLPKKVHENINGVSKLTANTFEHFISGQCLEAIILGLMFAVTMLLFRIPYAFVISAIIAVFALIPVVGSFIGCWTGILLILTDEPSKVILFVVLFLVLQQIEGNLIYPHVVGNSVGLPSIWVLFAVTVGGILYGVVGILLFIPLSSVIYCLFRGWVKKRIQNKK